MNIQELLIKGTNTLKSAHIATARLDSEVLLSERLSKERSHFLSHGDEQVALQVEDLFFKDIERRRRLEPIAYIIGKKEFMGLTFRVDSHVLIPRPDTEILVETILGSMERAERVSILDIGTGSGAIGISLAVFLPGAHVTAVDIDADALKIAEKNARDLNVDQRMDFLLSDCFKYISQRDFDVIVSNPPYIDAEEMAMLDANVVAYEPVRALSGGQDGLDLYRTITAGSVRYLKQNGKLFFEIGYRQAYEVTSMLKNNGFVFIQTIQDLAGRDRVVWGIKA
jgi:release factor glutamine methyltransferase